MVGASYFRVKEVVTEERGKEMDIYIYFKPEKEIDIDKLEENIEELLGDKGEVTGRGIGVSGMNIDVEIYDKDILDYFLQEIKTLDFPDNTYYVFNDMKKSLYDKADQ